jgi:hypothetical protein
MSRLECLSLSDNNLILTIRYLHPCSQKLTIFQAEDTDKHSSLLLQACKLRHVKFYSQECDKFNRGYILLTYNDDPLVNLSTLNL